MCFTCSIIYRSMSTFVRVKVGSRRKLFNFNFTQIGNPGNETCATMCSSCWNTDNPRCLVICLVLNPTGRSIFINSGIIMRAPTKSISNQGNRRRMVRRKYEVVKTCVLYVVKLARQNGSVELSLCSSRQRTIQRWAEMREYWINL
jgi:hypothetical protein